VHHASVQWLCGSILDRVLGHESRNIGTVGEPTGPPAGPPPTPTRRNAVSLDRELPPVLLSHDDWKPQPRLSRRRASGAACPALTLTASSTDRHHHGHGCAPHLAVSSPAGGPCRIDAQAPWQPICQVKSECDSDAAADACPPVSIVDNCACELGDAQRNSNGTERLGDGSSRCRRRRLGVANVPGAASDSESASMTSLAWLHWQVLKLAGCIAGVVVCFAAKATASATDPLRRLSGSQHAATAHAARPTEHSVRVVGHERDCEREPDGRVRQRLQAIIGDGRHHCVTQSRVGGFWVVVVK
jgi:hypothetical protein